MPLALNFTTRHGKQDSTTHRIGGSRKEESLRAAVCQPGPYTIPGGAPAHSRVSGRARGAIRAGEQQERQVNAYVSELERVGPHSLKVGRPDGVAALFIALDGIQGLVGAVQQDMDVGPVVSRQRYTQAGAHFYHQAVDLVGLRQYVRQPLRNDHAVL